ncbi:7749_t:CDS:2, partial [Acaulospora morrowiae]
TGNAFKLTKEKYPPSPPYFKGRFSNGLVWVDYFASLLNAKLFSYAYGGASCDSVLIKSSVGPDDVVVPGIAQQVDSFLLGDYKKFSCETTLVVFGTIILDYDRPAGSGSVEKVRESIVNTDPAKIVASVGERMEKLYKKGFKNFLLFISLPVGAFLTPTEQSYPPDLIKTLSEKQVLHNQYTLEAMNSFKKKHPDAILYLIKLDEIISAVFSPDSLKELGISVLNVGCIPDNGYAGKKSVVCKEPEKYAFYDNYTAVNTNLHKKVAEHVVPLVK